MPILLRLVVAAVLGVSLLSGPDAAAHVPAAAPTCGSLSASELDFEAPTLSGEAPAGGSCWILPLVAGEVLRVAPSSEDSPRWTVTDAAGALVCGTRWATPVECTTSGPAPYTLTVGERDSAYATRYDAQVVRLSDAQGCATLPEVPSGSVLAPTDGADLVPGQVACWRGVVADAQLRLLSADVGTRVELRAADQTVLCSGRARPCVVPAGDATLLVFARDHGTTPRAAGLVDLSRARTCPTLSTDWASEPATPRPSPLAVDCRSFDAETGEVLALPTSSAFSVRVAGPDGADACAPGLSTGICRITGPGPYRLISWYPSDSPWRDEYSPQSLFVHSVTRHVGCPVLAPSAPDDVGTPPEAVGCRVLAVEDAGQHLVDAGDDHPMTVVDQEGAAICRTRAGGCLLGEEETYVLVGTSFLPDSAPAVLRRLDDQGCPVLPDEPGAVWTVPAGMRSAACATLPQPSGATVVGVRPAGEGQRYGRILDAGGAVSCVGLLTERPCVLTGTAPFRAVRDGGAEPSRLSLVRLDQPSGCRPLPGGDFGTDAGADIELSGGQFVACLTVPRTDLPGETIFALARRTGDGVADLEIRDAHPGKCASEDGPGITAMSYCQIYQPASPTTTVLVRGDGRPGTWRVVRRPRGGDESCRPATPAEVGGAAVTGRLSSFLSLECWTFPAATTDHLVFDLHGLDEDVAMNVTGSSGRTCNDWGFEACALTGSASYRVVVRDRGFWDTAPDYELAVGVVARATEPVADCSPVPPAGTTISGVLDTDKTSVCLRLPVGSDYRLTLSPGIEPAAVDARLGNGWGTSCSWSEGAWHCRGPLGGARAPHGMLILRREDGAARVPLEATLDCQQCPAPIAEVPPSITGTPRPGSVLTADLGVWVPVPDSITYAWSVEEQDVSREPTFRVLPEHVGRRIHLHVVATFRGRTMATRASVTVVAEPETPVVPVPPVAFTPPVVSGSGLVGTVVRASSGTWHPAPDTVAHTWLVDGRPIRGQRGSTLTIGPALLGRRVSVEAVATNQAGSAIARSSTILVRPGTAPSVVRRPRLSGIPKVGRTVRVVSGAWSTKPAILAYRWTAGGRVLAATGPRLRLTRALAGRRVGVTVTARTPGYDDGRTTLSFRVRRR